VEALPGFLSIPRLAGLNRPAGAFFSAAVIGPAEVGVWRLRLEGETLLVSTKLDLTPGQTLKLKLVSLQGQRWLFQVVTDQQQSPVPTSQLPNPLMMAFLSRGLPLASERLTLWTRWLAGQTGPSDKEAWAASLEARGAPPYSDLADRITPWLAWQNGLESGVSTPPPEDEACWDTWNLQNTRTGDPWLVVPLHWEYQGLVDSGLLQAHWNPVGQVIDRWYLTAAPAGTAFRLEAVSRQETLRLKWCFFHNSDLVFWQNWVNQRPSRFLSTPELAVDLEVCGPPETPRAQGGINVEA